MWENLRQLSLSLENSRYHSNVLPELNPRRPYSLSWIRGLVPHKGCLYQHVLLKCKLLGFWAADFSSSKILKYVLNYEDNLILMMSGFWKETNWLAFTVCCSSPSPLQHCWMCEFWLRRTFQLSHAQGFSMKWNPVTPNNSLLTSKPWQELWSSQDTLRAGSWDYQADKEASWPHLPYKQERSDHSPTEYDTDTASPWGNYPVTWTGTTQPLRRGVTELYTPDSSFVDPAKQSLIDGVAF